MPKPMPSLTLVLDLDENLATEDVRLEIKRCYAYVCSTAVRKHATEQGQEPSNTAQFLVKMGSSKYLHSADEGADDLWNSVVEQWLYSTFHKVGNQMKIYNRRQREIGGTQLFFDWLDIDLQNKDLVVRVRLDSNSDIPPETNQVISQVRSALNAGLLGENVVRVQMPTDTSYALQHIAGMEAKEQREAQRAAEAAAEEQRLAEEKAAAIEQAAEDFVESPDLIEDPQMDELKALEAELEEKFSLPEADFAIDYTQWTICYADGSTRNFDSATGSFLDGE